MKKAENWKKCCKIEIAKTWILLSPEKCLHYQGRCPVCGHFIGLTATSKKEAFKFLTQVPNNKKLTNQEKI